MNPSTTLPPADLLGSAARSSTPTTQLLKQYGCGPIP